MFKKRLQKNTLVAVCPNEAGVAIARVRRHKDSTPNLEVCEVRDIQNLSLQGAEIAKLTRKLNLDRQACVTTLDLGTYSVLVVEAPEVEPDEMQAAIRWRVKDLIDFKIENAVIDVFETPNQRTPGKNILNAVVGRSDQVRKLIEILKEAGLNLGVVDIPEMAMRNIAALLPEDVAGMALLYLGRRDGLITITRQGTLYLSRRIEIGYESFSADVDANNTDRISQKLDNIVVEIQRSMDYYESHFSQPALTSIVVAPTPFPIPGLEKYMQTQLGVACRQLDINSTIDSNEPVAPEIQSRCFLAIGAALREETGA